MYDPERIRPSVLKKVQEKSYDFLYLSKKENIMYKYRFLWDNIFVAKLQFYKFNVLFSYFLFDRKTNKQEKTTFETSIIS